MALFAPDDLVALATLDVLRRGALVVGEPVADIEVHDRVARRVHVPKDLDPADRAALLETLTDWMAPAAGNATDALAATPRGVRR